MTQITEWLIVSSTLIVLVFILRTLFAGKVRWKGIYVLWALVAVRLLLPINLIASPMSILNFFSRPQTVMEEVKQDTYSPVSESKGTIRTDNLSEVTESKVEKSEHEQLADSSSNVNTNTVPETTVQTHTHSKTHRFGTWTLFFIWSAGFILILSTFTVCNIILHCRLSRNRKYMETFNGLRVYSSDVFRIPCLHGLFRPAIYLPDSFSKNIPDVRKKQILTHEWVHYRHGDSFWSALRILLLAAYWFHPLVWVAAVCSKKDAELACDEKVINLLGDDERVSYGTMLIDTAANMRSRMDLYLTTPVSRQGKSLKHRIHALEKRNYSKVMTYTLIFSVLLMTGTTFTGCVPGTGKQSTKNVTAEKKKSISQSVAESLYGDFLKEHQGEKDFSYYSVISLGDTSCPVLLTSDKITEKKYLAGQSPVSVSNNARLYSIIKKKVTYLGDIACEDKEEWLHYCKGKLMTTTHDSVSKQWVEPEEEKVQTVTYMSDVDSIGTGGAAATPSDGCFDEESENPTDSPDIPHEKVKGNIYMNPIREINCKGEEIILSDSADAICDDGYDDIEPITTYDVSYEEDNYGAWRSDFDNSDSVIFFRNTDDTMTDFSTQNYLMHILTENSCQLYIDITGDGVADTVSIDINAAKGEYQADGEELPPSIQIISGKTNEVIWESNANASLHAGYNQFYLYQNKHTYLMEWNPACWQGYCSYQWKVFKLTEDGKVKKIAGNKIEFDTNEGRVKEKDFGKIEAFGKELNKYLADAELLLDTVPDETPGIPENGTANEPIRIFGAEKEGESYFDYETVIRELKAILNK
ncbi:MAG: M56 family metallopeptidase [Lachnospiraceae bacterium]|nr:M56 family metallopeptidase [Lachnospiraceae bacterium]